MGEYRGGRRKGWKESCGWEEKKKKKVKGRVGYVLKEIYKIKITTLLGHNNVSQKFQNNWVIKFFMRVRLATIKNKWYCKNIVTFYYILARFILVLHSLGKKNSVIDTIFI